MSSADAFILVYDVTDSSTFDEARVIRDQIHETKVVLYINLKLFPNENLFTILQATTAVPIVVVGNKIDLLEENPDLREVNAFDICFYFYTITMFVAKPLFIVFKLLHDYYNSPIH